MDDQAPLKIIINGQEYDPTEAEQFIELGKKTKDYETKYNTNLEKVWPEYTRTSQALKQTEQELADAKAQLTEFQSKKESEQTPQDMQDAQEAARKLGIVLTDDTKDYLKRDDLDKWYEDRRSQEQAINTILASGDKLEKDIDGTDGRPAFNKKVVMAYAGAYGFKDLNEAYEDMHKDKIDAWKSEQIDRQKAKSLKTMRPGGAKQPASVSVTGDNFRKSLGESLWGAEE